MIVKKRNGSLAYVTYDEDSGNYFCHNIPGHMGRSSLREIHNFLCERGDNPDRSATEADESTTEDYLYENNLTYLEPV